MILKNFIEQFVCPNTLIRLHHVSHISGISYESANNDEPEMEWKLVNSEFANKEVIGVTDILYLHDSYSEAVNIVIER